VTKKSLSSFRRRATNSISCGRDRCFASDRPSRERSGQIRSCKSRWRMIAVTKSAGSGSPRRGSSKGNRLRLPTNQVRQDGSRAQQQRQWRPNSNEVCGARRRPFVTTGAGRSGHNVCSGRRSRSHSRSPSAARGAEPRDVHRAAARGSHARDRSPCSPSRRSAAVVALVAAARADAARRCRSGHVRSHVRAHRLKVDLLIPRTHGEVVIRSFGASEAEEHRSVYHWSSVAAMTVIRGQVRDS
jgi:hypothetical protein